MKIWIVTSKFGQGHFSVAQALKEQFEEQGHDVVVDDIISIKYPKLDKAIYYTFNNVICRNSSVYNFLTYVGWNSKGKISDNANSLRLFREIKPDIIITTWSACARMLGHLNVPIYTCITDVGAHKGWLCSNVSGYFVASERAKNTLIEYGIESEKIYLYSIPVKKIYHSVKKKRTLGKKVLIMGGGLGIISWLDDVIIELQQDPEIEITVIAGKNKKLFTKLKTMYPKVNTIGFTREVHKYMSQADVVLSKPGGVSLFESIYCETPFVAINPEYPHEKVNAEFILDRQIGEVIYKEESISSRVIKLLESKDKRIKLQKNLSNLKWQVKSFEDMGIFVRRQNVV